jgi:allantoicase
MRTIKEQLREQLLHVYLRQIEQINNNKQAEGGLYMIIAQELVDERLNNANIVVDNEIRVEVMDLIEDKNTVEENGAWIYSDGTVDKWEFRRCNTIAEAVRAAIHMINAKVLCNGEEIVYDSLNENTAYYIDKRTNEAKMVAI